MNVDRMAEVARAARNMGTDFPGCLSRGESVTAALVLNRPDWLKKLDYTIAEAIHRLDVGDAERLLQAQRLLQAEAPLVEA